MVDYRKFRPSLLGTKEFSHLKLLFFWPVYGIAFLLLERVLPLDFHEVYCPLDDLIPFCEYFIIPYYMWFVYLIGMIIYLGLMDIPNFRKYMWFIIISYSVTVVIYLVYPTCQNLRPVSFERDNIFTRIAAGLYSFDTNTNVCPSIHVLGMTASFCAGLKAKGMQSVPWKIFWWVSLILVCVSTVFLKQHSVIDIAAGAVLSFVTYIIVYKTKLFSEEEANV
ncbi:MAG: phosphatase PAP2 family protein [Eubacteriales bacterium]